MCAHFNHGRCQMKESLDATAVERALETEEFSNRRLIRPTFNRAEHNHSRVEPAGERRERPERTSAMSPRKSAPPEQTNAENFYYQMQMQCKTPLVLVLHSGDD